MRAGIFVYAVGSIAAGILDMVWGNFEPAHQPIQAFGDNIPGQKIFACIVALLLVAAGAAILWRRTTKAGAMALGLVYLLFAAFWLPRFYTATHVLGFRIPVLIGLVVGIAQQLILVVAAIVVYTSPGTSDIATFPRVPLVVRWIFGLSSIDFGLAHFAAAGLVSAMVPKWIPFGGDFWTMLTGLAFVLAGVAILSAVLDVLAARLLAVMLLMFSLFALAPLPFASPHNHAAWGGNAYNLAAVGAVWIFAASLVSRRAHRQGQGQPATCLIGHP